MFEKLKSKKVFYFWHKISSIRAHVAQSIDLLLVHGYYNNFVNLREIMENYAA